MVALHSGLMDTPGKRARAITGCRGWPIITAAGIVRGLLPWTP
jgi:hypothetical protein